MNILEKIDKLYKLYEAKNPKVAMANTKHSLKKAKIFFTYLEKTLNSYDENGCAELLATGEELLDKIKELIENIKDMEE